MDLTIEETWEAFFADDAPFYFDKLIKMLGDEVKNVTSWVDIDNKRYEEVYGYEIDKMRLIKTRMEIEGIPFADHSDTTNRLLLASKTDNELVFIGIDNSLGIPYAKTFETHNIWEFRSPFPGSKKVVMGHSLAIIWINKPFLVDGAIANTIKGKMKKSATMMREFFKTNAEDWGDKELILKS
jgi:hypothetical protein